MSKIRLASVQWEDSCSSSGWEHPHEDKRFLIRSFGILVREGKKSVTISTSRSSQGDRYMDQLTIPRSAIRKMKTWKH